MNDLNRTQNLNKTTQDSPDPVLIDLNILPPRHRQRRIRFMTILPWVLWVILLALLYPVGRRFLEVEGDFRTTRLAYQQVQSTRESYQPRAEEINALETEIAQVDSVKENIQSSLENIQVESPLWSELISRVRQETPTRIDLVSVVQEEDQLLVSGLSKTYQDVLEMEDNLKDNEAFAAVHIESISETQINQPTPTAVPTDQTGEVSGQPQPTPTPLLGYAFQISIQVDEGGIQP